MATEMCIACGSADLRRDDAGDDAWCCNACAYENDTWRQLAARRWVERTFMPAVFDASSGALTLPFMRGVPERWETRPFAGGELSAGFTGDRFAAIRVSMDAPDFAAAFERGFRPMYDQWSGSFRCTAVDAVEPLGEALTVTEDEESDDFVWIQLDARGRLAVISIANEWPADLPWATMSLGGRMFEMDTGER